MPMVEKLRRRIRGWRRHTSAVFAFADRRTLAPSKAMIRMRMRMVPRMKMMRLCSDKDEDDDVNVNFHMKE